MATLVGRNKFATALLCFLIVGHTHEDIDQFIGQLCSWLHHQPVAQTPQDFVRLIQGFLNTFTKKPWPQDARDRRCVYINQGRDWKTWLEAMPGLKTTLGPALPMSSVSNAAVAVHAAC